jgi:hypothetical protein
MVFEAMVASVSFGFVFLDYDTKVMGIKIVDFNPAQFDQELR